MSKNMTKKGLALGAASALVVAGFSTVPASAAGLADTSFVSLTPTTGTEYTVLAAVNDVFKLSANEAATVSTGDLKFLVSDPNSLVEPTAATEGRTVTLGDDAVVSVTDSATSTITVTLAGHSLSEGDKFAFTSGALQLDGFVTAGDAGGATALTGAAKDAILTVSAVADANTFAFVGGDLSAVEADLAGAVSGAETITVLREARTTTGTDAGTFVIDTGSSSATNVEDIVLATSVATTVSITVQAWMDANDNDTIDSTEYASPVRTVTWIKPSEVVATTTMAPVVGDTALVASVSTTPVLNGEQTLANNPVAINAKFTRSLSTSAGVYADNTDTSGATSNTSSVWSDVTKTFTVSVNTDADDANEADDAAGNDAADAWAGLAAPIATANELVSLAISTTGVVSAVTTNNHGLVSGDTITMVVDADDTAIALAAEAAARTVTVTGAKTFTYTVSETTGLPTTAVAATNATKTTNHTLTTYTGPQGLVDRVGAETYSAQATVDGTLNGNIVTTGVVAAAAATATVSTAASTTVQGAAFTAEGVNVVKVLAGTLSVPVTVTVTDADGDAVGAGRAVKLDISAGSGSTASTLRINGKATTDTVLTDANGQVTGTVTVSTAVDGVDVTVKATAENIAVADVDLQWEDAAFGLVDLNGTEGTLSAGNIARNVIKLGSYDLNLMVADQWFNAPTAGTYRLNVTGEGVAARYVSLVDGKATITATDTGVFETSMDTVVKLEKVSGTTVLSTSTFTFQAGLSDAYKVAVGAAGSTLYGSAVVASVAVAEKALVEIDKRTSSTATPAYANNLVLNGQVSEKATSAAKSGAVVTVSGSNSILFEEDKVAKRGSLTFHTDSNGKFELKAYSTTAMTDSVVTFTTSDGATGTIKVSFTGTGVGEGTSLVLTVPAAVKPASTFKVLATLQDAYGNPVDTAADRVKVTHVGPGIVYGTLPTQTDAFGELSFSVLLGSNDSADMTFTVSYDQNGDGDFKDAKDLTVAKTVEINASGVASSEQKVNAGSFKGYVALYAKGYAGQRMSAKVGKDWVVVPALASDFERVVEFTGAGVDVAVRIYIDRVLMDTINLTTK